MKDKVKGLVLGAILGSAITGTAAYASGGQIEVLFRPLTYLFDGVEKKPSEGTGFIYDGSTYVPIRFVSEALGKEVGWDDATGTITIDEPGSSQVVAKYKDDGREVNVTRRTLNKQMAIARLFNPSYDQYAEDAQFAAQMQTEAAVLLVIERRMDTSVKEESAAQGPSQLAELKQQFDHAFSGQYSWETRLNQLKLSEADVLRYLQLTSLRTVYLNNQATAEALAAAYETATAAHQFDKATVAHILIGFQDADGAERTKEAALERAKEVLAKLRAGGDFAAAALEYSDDPGSKSNGGRYVDAYVSDWVEGFKEAVLKQPVGQIGEPVETAYGYHIIKVESRTTPSLEEVNAELKEQLMNSAYQKLIQVDLPALQQTTD